MLLRFSQIKEMTQGAVRIVQEDTGIRFYRFTQEEEALYEPRDGLYAKTFAPAGIRLEFETDATSLALEVNAYMVTSRSYFRVDVLKDGVMLGGIQNYPADVQNGTYPGEKYPLGVYSGTFSLGEGTKRVTVQLPWSVPCELRKLELTGATYAKPLPRKRKFLIYGDSITQGYDTLFPSLAYAVRLCDHLEAEGFNKAIGGEVYCPALAEAPSGVEPDVIFCAYGVNDWHQLTQPEFEDRCRRFWSAICAKYPGAEKYALTPIWFLPAGETAFGSFENVEKTIRSVLEEFPEVKVLRGWDFVPHDPECYGDGRLHPNAEGFAEYCKNLLKALKPYFA